MTCQTIVSNIQNKKNKAKSKVALRTRQPMWKVTLTSIYGSENI